MPGRNVDKDKAGRVANIEIMGLLWPTALLRSGGNSLRPPPPLLKLLTITCLDLEAATPRPLRTTVPDRRMRTIRRLLSQCKRSPASNGRHKRERLPRQRLSSPESILKDVDCRLEHQPPNPEN